MKTTFSILFFIKKGQPKRNGLCTIMVRITINNESVQFSTQAEVSPLLWNQSLGMLNGKTRVSKDMNERLSFIRSELAHHYHELSKENHYIHPIRLKNAYLVKKEERLLSYQFEHQLKNLNLKSRNSLSKEVFARYRLTWKRIKAFMEIEYKTSDIYIDKIDLDFLNRCYWFLRKQYGYNNNTAMKYMQRFSTIIKFAERTGIIYPNPFELYHFHLDKFNPTVLSEDEINRIWNKKLRMPRLKLTRDVFIFSCYTGLSYGDICHLRKEDIRSFDNRSWLQIIRRKTDKECYIPLLPISLQLIEQYKTSRKDDLLFPIYSNQKTNEYLKEIAEVCGITKNLTFHVSRHSFATLLLTYGVSIESISHMLGHVHIKTTQIYAQINKRKVENEMKKVSQKLSGGVFISRQQQLLLEIAIKMKKDGFSLKQILKYTGLKKVDIEHLA